MTDEAREELGPGPVVHAMADELQDAPLEDDKQLEEVLFVYAPANVAHEGGYVHGLPRGVDITRRHVQQAGLDEGTLDLDPALYRRKGETRAQATKRRRDEAAESTAAANTEAAEEE